MMICMQIILPFPAARRKPGRRGGGAGIGGSDMMKYYRLFRTYSRGG